MNFFFIPLEINLLKNACVLSSILHVKPYVISFKISSFLLGCFIISPIISLKSSVSIQVVLPVHFNVWDILLDTTVQIDLYHAKKKAM